jgi:hypothetical protein
VVDREFGRLLPDQKGAQGYNSANAMSIPPAVDIAENNIYIVNTW